MELVDGSDLSALVKKNGPFTVENAVNYPALRTGPLWFVSRVSVIRPDLAIRLGVRWKSVATLFWGRFDRF